MKFVLPFAAALVAGLAAPVAVQASQDYTLICNSSRLLASDRHECRVQMTAAATEAERVEIYRVYDAKIASLSLASQRG